MSFGNLIRQRRKELSLTQDHVARKTGISKPYLSNIETDKVLNPPTDGVLQALERVLEMEPGTLLWLAHVGRTPVDVREKYEMLTASVRKMKGALESLYSRYGSQAEELDLDLLAEELGDGGNIRRLAPGVAVPVINQVSAGYPSQFTDLDYPPSIADEYVRCPDMHDPQGFAARVVGDSMEPKYGQGDIVVFSPNTEPRNGDDCFVRFERDVETTFKRFYLDDEQTIRLQPRNDKYPAQVYPREAITGLWPALFVVQRIRD